jgi:hypothetical protein
MLGNEPRSNGLLARKKFLTSFLAKSDRAVADDKAAMTTMSFDKKSKTYSQ